MSIFPIFLSYKLLWVQQSCTYLTDRIYKWFKCWNVEVELLSPKIYTSSTLLDSKQLFLKWLYQFTLPLVISGYLFPMSSSMKHHISGSMKVYQGYLTFHEQEMRLSIFTIYFPRCGFSLFFVLSLTYRSFKI